MLRAHPKELAILGTVIIVFSAIGFVDMGGFFIDAVLGIIGGAFAISFRLRTAKNWANRKTCYGLHSLSS